MTNIFDKQTKSDVIDNLLSHNMLPQNSVIIVHQDKNIIAKIAKCLEKTK